MLIYCQVSYKSMLGYCQVSYESSLAIIRNDLQELSGADLRNIKGQLPTSGVSSKQASRKQFVESTNPNDFKNSEPPSSLSNENLYAADPASLPSTSRVAEVVFNLL